MEVSGYNIILKRKRKEAKLSLIKASYKLKISFRLLRLIEKGYYIVPEKYYKRFIDFYGLPQDFFTNNLLYPLPIKPHERKTLFFFRNKKFSLFMKIFLASIVLVSFFMVPYGLYYVNYSNTYASTYYGEKFNSFYQAGMQKGTLTPSKTYYEYKTSFTSDEKDENVKFSLYADVGFMKNSVYSYNASSKKANLKVDINIAYSYNGILISIISDNYTSSKFTYNGGRYNIIEIYGYDNGKKVKYTDQDPNYFIYAGIGLAFVKEAQPALNKTIESLGIKDYKFEQLCYDLHLGYSSYKSVYRNGIIHSVVFATLGSGALLLFIVFLVFDISKKKSIATETSLVDNNLDNIPPNPKPLKKNFFFPTFFSQFFCYSLVNILIFLSSLATFILIIYILNFVGNGGSFDVETALNLLNIKGLTASFIPIAIILNSFVKVDSFLTYRLHLRNAMCMFIFGVMYYVAECFIGYCTASGFSNFSIIIKAFSFIFPGNMFFGLSCYSFFAMFLFSKPFAAIKNEKIGILWKFGIILPLTYLFLSYLFPIGEKALLWPSLPLYIQYLFYQRSFIVSVFVLVFYLGIYLWRRKYADNYNIFSLNVLYTGTKYLLFKNILAASIIAVIGCFELIFSFGINWNASPFDGEGWKTFYNIMETLGAGKKQYFILCLIPIIIFYHPYFGKRRIALDGVHATLMGVCYAFPYVLTLILVLPSISVLEPYLEVFFG